MPVSLDLSPSHSVSSPTLVVKPHSKPFSHPLISPLETFYGITEFLCLGLASETDETRRDERKACRSTNDSVRPFEN